MRDIKAEDEAFWKEQEGRVAGRMAQPCCSLAGMANLLARLRGDFAVVVHGENDCLNSFLQYEGGAASRFYCTRVSQAQFVSGKSAAALSECLELLIAQRSPRAVFVLGTCLTDMISDDLAAVAGAAQRRTGTPVFALRTGGLQAGSQAEALDWLFATLASLPQSPRTGGSRSRVNLIGLPPLEGGAAGEFAGLLDAAGLAVNGSYPGDGCLEDWEKVSHAGRSFVVDRSLYPRFLERLAASGLPAIEVPLPVGLRATLRFCASLSRVTGRARRVAAAVAADLRRAERRLQAFRKRFGGMRLALGLRMVNDYRVDNLAYAGAGEAGLFLDAGFEVTLLIQGPTDARSRQVFQERLERQGWRLPFHVFPDPCALSPLLREGRFDLACLADHARGEARRAGIPMIQNRSMGLFLRAIPANLDYLERAIGESR
jgi:nitrogenase molybdenum-cofactor synthesis protein NifE